MAIYTDIIKTLGKELVEYNVSGWALFRDQMAMEISSQYVLGNERRPDESLLASSLEDIKHSLSQVKGGKTNFTYYTQSGPQSKINDTIQGAELLTFNTKSTSEFNTHGDDLQYRTDKGLSAKQLHYKEGGVNFPKTKEDEDFFPLEDEPLTLLQKTNKWFSEGASDYLSKRFATLTSRFHTDNNQIPIYELEHSIGLQGFSKQYGLSRGNSVLKAEGIGKDAKHIKVEDGVNPYCRVWTWHNAYSHYLKDTMRPFSLGENESLDKTYNWKIFRSHNNLIKGALSNGTNNSEGGELLTKLQSYGVMYNAEGIPNGLVNITPSLNPSDKSFDVPVKKCMFSIENLAWKGTYNSWNTDDINGLSKEQKGPLGGRIMWFPPYDLRFNETTQANWQTNEFIGRGEPMYTYANTVRSGTLSFKLLIDHPAILDYWERRNGKRDSVENSGIDNVESKEQELLRFFAGCSVLKAGMPQTETPEASPEVQEDGAPQPENSQLKFEVFFPNNYSGVSEDVNFDPIDYLINGIATNINIYDETIEPDPTIQWFDTKNNKVGGYGIRQTPLSIITKPTEDSEIATVKSSDGIIRTLKKIKNKKDEPLYCYRVDAGLNEVLKYPASYVNTEDKNCYNKNPRPPKKEEKRPRTLVSFTDVYIALNKNNPKIGEIKKVLEGCYDEGRVQMCERIFKSKECITGILCRGYASSQGTSEHNQKLAKNRADTIKKWLEETLNPSLEQGIKTSSRPFTGSTLDSQSANNETAIEQRRTEVYINYNESKIEDASETQVSVDVDSSSDIPSSVMSQASTEPAVLDNTTTTLPPNTSTNEEIGRYDNEARFFERLGKESPFMTKLISERIRNFDPVFHSMNPEGFNARLTFLNQCMRQGPTLSGIESKNANNLAFGVPPVCVLRVGDFYNTKIIITNMNIGYDPLVWDLNEEGIGVMPMIANVDLSFNFIGGSDLGGPIQRLQNATSFNYYANASVYDNRAEEIDYANGKPLAFKAYEPDMYKE